MCLQLGRAFNFDMKHLSLLIQRGILLASLGMLSLPLHAVNIEPPTMQDIVGSLGQDARGLQISQDALPDLFTLTASRIEEDSKIFQVAQPYTEGRWKGGKVVIEYARDLSYTMVSVYDKGGRRQRIYSVRSHYSAHREKAQIQTASRKSLAEVQPVEVPQEEMVPESEPEPELPPVETSARSSKRSVSRPESSRQGTKKRSGKSEETMQVASLPTAVPAVSAVKSVESSSSHEEAGTYEWNDRLGAYVPTQSESKSSGGSESAREVRTEEPSVSAPVTERSSEGTAVSKSKKTSRSSNSSRVSRTKTSAPYATVARQGIEGEVWIAGSSKTGSESSAQGKPEKKKKEKSAKTASSSPASFASESAGSAAPPAAVPTPVPTGRTEIAFNSGSGRKEWSSGGGESLAGVPEKSVTDEAVPSTEELLMPEPKQSSKTSRAESRPESRPENRPEANAQPAVDVPLKTTVEAQVESKRLPKAGRMENRPEVSARPVEDVALKTTIEPPSKTVMETPSKSTTEELLAESNVTGPDTGDSDKWVPKKVVMPKPAPEPELPATSKQTKVAMLPKAQVDNSIDGLLKKAGEAKGEMPREGDSWVPKNSKAISKEELDMNAELARIKKEEKEKQKKIAPSVKVKRDVNNPEEGVLPVSSFEKFSGPMYGRHREYERRFHAGKRGRIAKEVPEHDFYVDEVDRKKEIHNVYYYKHEPGKAPRLVGVQKHDKVSFLSNYDIGKEDSGKISKYN